MYAPGISQPRISLRSQDSADDRTTSPSLRIYISLNREIVIGKGMGQQGRAISECRVPREFVHSLFLPFVRQLMPPAFPKDQGQVLLEHGMQEALPFRRLGQFKDDVGDIPFTAGPGLGQEAASYLHDTLLERRERQEILG